MNQTQYKVLIVDDDVSFRRLLARTLTGAGYKIIDSDSPIDETSAACQIPDLAIVDYRIPSDGGRSYIKALHDNGSKFPIVFCTDLGIDQKLVTSMSDAYHVDMIMQKPIQPEMFVEQIADWLLEKNLVRQPLEGEEAINCSIEHIEDSHTRAIEAERLIKETEEAIAELGYTYLFELSSEFEQMAQEVAYAFENNDKDALYQAANRAHQIKGTGGSLGFSELGQFGSLIEKQLNSAGKMAAFSEELKLADVLFQIDEAVVWTRTKLTELATQSPTAMTITAN